MTLNTFFRPTPATLIGSLAITGIAAVLLMRTLLCALNGAGDCFQLPVAIQAILLLILWPWVLIVRFLGLDNMQLLTVFGLVASLVWVYAVLCVKRWIIGLFLRKRQKEGNS